MSGGPGFCFYVNLIDVVTILYFTKRFKEKFTDHKLYPAFTKLATNDLQKKPYKSYQ